MKYRFLDITSDVMFEAYGKNFEELLENSALAMFSVICEVDKIKPLNIINIKVSAKNQEMLLYSWLSELLTQSEINELFFSRFKVEELLEKRGELYLCGVAKGENMSVEKGRTLVKGVTYYKAGIEKTESGYKTKVTLDI